MTGRHRRPGRWLAAIAVSLVGALGLVGAPAARADHAQITILEDDPYVFADPLGALTRLQAIGATTVRLNVPWAAIAPRPSATRAPRFDATDPAAYPARAWAGVDAVIVAAAQLGITVDFDLAPGAPRWATGGGQPHDKGYPHWQWEPDTAAFGRFVTAVGERYGGNWNPDTERLDPGDPNDLPRVGFWSVWNEPNYGPSLAPQGLPGHPGTPASPARYRALVDAAWRGLARSGHRLPGDRFLFGELAPRSQLTAPGQFRDFNGMTPVVFLQNLYCLDDHYRPLRGTLARLEDCPTTSAQSARFTSAHPALFAATGVSDHPYDEWFAPDQERNLPPLRGWATENTQDASLATIGNLVGALDRLTAAYGNHEHLPIYDTEYGYQTSPPHRIWAGDHRPWPSPDLAAMYDNWAEYLHWRNPRLRSFSQYLLEDAVAPTAKNDYGAFPSGLVDYRGRPKADFDAFRMPIFLPRTTTASNRSPIEVWGAVRPAASLGPADGTGGLSGPGGLGPTPPGSDAVDLHFRPRGGGPDRLLATVALGPQGYYDTRITLPESGTLTARWTVPFGALAGLTTTSIASRPVTVTVR